MREKRRGGRLDCRCAMGVSVEKANPVAQIRDAGRAKESSILRGRTVLEALHKRQSLERAVKTCGPFA